MFADFIARFWQLYFYCLIAAALITFPLVVILFML